MRHILIRQEFDNDCGPACIASFLKMCHKNVSITKIKSICKTDNYGTSGKGLQTGFEYFGFKIKWGKVISLDNGSLNKQTPFIACMKKGNQNHFVIIYSINKNRIVVGDPSIGIVKTVPTEFQKTFTHIVLLVNKTDGINDIDENEPLLQYIFTIAKSKFKTIILIGILSILVTAVGLVFSYYFKVVVDTIIPKRCNYILAWTSLLIITISIFNGIFDYLRQSIILKLSKSIDIEIISSTLKKLLHVPMQFYDNNKSGEIISRIQDLNTIRDMIVSIFVVLFLDIIVILICSIVLMNINNVLFLIALIDVVINGIVLFGFKNSIIKGNEKVLSEKAEYNSKLLNAVNGYEIIKGRNIYTWTLSELNEIFAKFTSDGVKISKLISFELILKDIIQKSFLVIIIGLGACYVISGEMSVGELLMFYTLISLLLSPVSDFLQLVPKYNACKVAYDKVCGIILSDYENLNLQVKGSLEFQEIRVKDVSFKYPSSRKNVLNNFSMIAKKNQSIMIVGQTGSGKTTLAKLIMRFYQPLNGNIYVDGKDINQLNNFKI